MSETSDLRRGGGRDLRVIITGAGGFAGRHLVPLLEERGMRPFASPIRLPDREGFARFAAEVRPHAVVHLAALSFIPDGEANPLAAFEANVEGTTCVAEGLRDADPEGRARLIVVSSGHVCRAGAAPIDEQTPIDPQNVYGRTKVAAEFVATILCQAPPPRALITFRPFNHTGPGQRPEFAASNFARQTALIEAGRQEPILQTGDLGVRRDFSDVRDIVRAYAMAAAGEVPPGLYHLASGRAPSLAEIAAHFQSRSRVHFEIRSRAEPRREGEAREIRGDADRIRELVGWRAEIPLAQTLDDLLAWWRARVSAGEVE